MRVCLLYVLAAFGTIWRVGVDFMNCTNRAKHQRSRAIDGGNNGEIDSDRNRSRDFRVLFLAY